MKFSTINICTLKDTINKVKRQPTEWENFRSYDLHQWANHRSGKGLACTIRKVLTDQ